MTKDSDFDEYIKTLERDLSLDPSRSEINYLLQGLKKQKGGQLQESIVSFQQAKREFRKYQNLGGQSLCCGYIAISLDKLNEPYKSVNYYRRACKFALASKSLELNRLSYSSLGSAYDRIGKSSKAIASYEIAVEAAKLLNDRANQALCYFGMSIVYSSKQQYRKSIEKAQLALELYRRIGNTSGEIRCIIRIAISLTMLKDYRLAIDHYEQARAAMSKCPNEFDALKDVYFGMAISNDGLLKYRKAIKYYKKSLAISIQINDVETQARCYALLDTASFNLGHHRKSIYYSNQVISLAKENKDTRTQVTYSINIADDYHRTGQNQKALVSFRGICLNHMLSVKTKVHSAQIPGTATFLNR